MIKKRPRPAFGPNGEIEKLTYKQKREAAVKIKETAWWRYRQFGRALNVVRFEIRRAYPRMTRLADWGEARFGWFNVLVAFCLIMCILALAGVIPMQKK